jgi:hypothetical protein
MFAKKIRGDICNVMFIAGEVDTALKQPIYFALMSSSILLSVPVWAIAATHVTQVRD